MPYLAPAMTDERQRDAFIEELRSLVDRHIRSAHQWYSSRTKQPRFGFRISGIIVVIGSLTLPVITAIKDWRFKDEVLTVVSLSVAIVSSLSTFYRWDLMWHSRAKTTSDLEAILGNWELDVTAASIAENPRGAALAATQRAFQEAFRAVGAETTQFFASVKFPEVPRGGH